MSTHRVAMLKNPLQITCDLQRGFQLDHFVIWQVFWSAKLFNDCDLTTIYLYFSNRNMIGGSRSISKNLFAQRSLPSTGILTIFCWLQVLLDLRYIFFSINRVHFCFVFSFWQPLYRVSKVVADHDDLPTHWRYL